MKKHWFWLEKQKLNIKFTIVIGIIVFIPVSVIFFVLFHNMKDNTLKQELNNLQYKMNQNYQEVQTTVDLCNMSTQVVLNYQNLNEFLVLLADGESIKTSDLVEFYKNDISMLDSLVNSNPYLHQIRIYSNNNEFTEMMPILYRRERMEQLSWASNYTSGQWQFDYKDEIFSRSANTSTHTMALITSINDYERGEISVIEVAVLMDRVFPEVFLISDSEWACFVDKDGNIYSSNNKNTSNKWGNIQEDIVALLDLEPREERYLDMVVADERVIIGVMPMKELSGYVIHLISIEESLSNLDTQRNIYFSGLAVAFVILVFFINIIVKALLKRFYIMLKTIRKIQKGNIGARIAHTGADEMGELGENINLMLEKIEELMQGNINRELLMKNSEIRALQNQINAHFIYNVLESIKMMAEIDEKYDISDAITSLGKLLRYGMKWSTENVTVEQEIDYIKNYLDLINLRFDYSISLGLTIPDVINKQLIPKMSLQPIVENAIYHGIEELAQDSSIYLKAMINGNDFVIEITDSGKGMSEVELDKLHMKIYGEVEVGGGSGNGIGLKNVQDRIRTTFGENYGISIHSEINRYTKVVIRLPLTHREV